MKTIEKTLGRREFLGNTLKTAAGITLIGTPLISSCAIEDWGYTFDLSGLNSWQADLFLEAGKYWGIDEGRNDNSHNKAYFGETPIKPETGLRARAFANLKVKGHIPAPTKREPIPSEPPVPRLIWKYTIVFNDPLYWVNCDAKDEDGNFMRGKDFYMTAAHEWGHVIRKDREHSSDPESPLHQPSPHRCPDYGVSYLETKED